MDTQHKYITPKLQDIGSIEEVTGFGWLWWTTCDWWTDWAYYWDC